MRLQSVITVAAVLLGNRGLVIASRNASLPTYTALDFDPLAAKLPTASIQAAASQTPSADFLAALAKGKLPISNKTTIASANAFESSRNRCPATCSEAGIAPTNWTVYHDANRLSACNETMLLDFAVYNPLNDPETQVRIRACTADANTDVQSLSQSTTAASCISHNSTAPLQATLQLGSLAGSGLGSTAEVLDATQNLAKRLIYVPKSCDSTVNFAYSGQSVVAVYAGAEIQSQGIATTVLQQFIKHLQTSPVSGNTFLQLCGTSDRGSDYAMGIMASTNASLALAQSAVKMWHDGKCLTSDDATTPWSNVTILAPTPSSQGNSTSHTTPVSRAIRPRATCSTIQVVSGDGCASLASKCGITAAQFTTYNPSSTLCSTLSVGESVCCSAGTLPDFSPQPNPDGSCATYLVVSGDYCSAIAASHSITIAEIEQFNNETWGWTGCDNLQVGVNMCLSTGTPPFPAPLANAVCGPQVPGTVAPTDGSDIALLNQCPLLACCDIWGQCGTTLEFCSETESSTGAPGTAEAGTNGCISNCGTQIIIGAAPAEFRKIGYFEAFNWDRICLNMDVTDIDTSEFTHIHLAFASITNDFAVNVTGIQDQFDMFVGLTGVKRILSFGGWSFSTDQDTYPIFREGVTAANRATFISNLVSFVNLYKLDGIDFDWEYPGATDIPGIPPGSPDDGINYFEFLYELKMELGFSAKGASLSIAAPAGYWYLKNFPIEAIAVEVDYIVFMTYDLHGQWDYGSAWSQEGCPAGNCLRSHVNLTETINSLSMITKAGVPSNQVVVGVSSYGRSFGMTTPGCFGEMCTYYGPISAAAPGECTLTPGYIANAEIDDIINQGLANQTFLDESYSNIVVYNDVQWVAYMDDDNKAVRSGLYTEYSMGGTSDWAIDLRSFSSAGGSAGGSLDLPDCTNTYATIDDVIADTSIPTSCMNQYIIGALGTTLDTAITDYNSIMADGYTTKFNAYAEQVKTEASLNMQDFYTNHLDNYFTCTYSVSNGKGGFTNQTGPGCPPKSEPSKFSGYEWNIYMEPNDINAFYEFVQSTYGIDSSWIIFKEWQYGECLPKQQDCSTFGNIIGQPDADPNLVVPDPKDLIQAGLTNFTLLSAFLSDTAVAVEYYLYWGNSSDVVDAAAMPVFMVENAITNMKNVSAIGENAIQEQRKDLILNIIMAVLMVLPGVGEVLEGVADLTFIARMIEMVADIGNVAQSVYDVVENPSSAPLAVMGLLLGGLGKIGTSDDSVAEAAAVRRGMTEDTISGLGPDVKAAMDKVSSVVQRCSG